MPQMILCELKFYCLNKKFKLNFVYIFNVYLKCAESCNKLTASQALRWCYGGNKTHNLTWEEKKLFPPV